MAGAVLEHHEAFTHLLPTNRRVCPAAVGFGVVRKSMLHEATRLLLDLSRIVLQTVSVLTIIVRGTTGVRAPTPPRDGSRATTMATHTIPATLSAKTWILKVWIACS